MLERQSEGQQHLSLEAERGTREDTGGTMGWTINEGPRDVAIQILVAKVATRLGVGEVEVTQFELRTGGTIYPYSTIITDNKNTQLSGFWRAVDACKELIGDWLQLEKFSVVQIDELARVGVRIGYGTQRNFY